LRRVREIFLSIADDSFIVIDGTRTREEIFEIVRADFESQL
jgi:hypothetical protein